MGRAQLGFWGGDEAREAAYSGKGREKTQNNLEGNTKVKWGVVN